MPDAPRRAAFIFIFISVVLDVLALGIIIPVLPKLIEDFLGGDTEKAAPIYGLFGTVWALMQFIFAPILGVLSDRVGRRPVLLLSMLGLGLDYILMALAPTLAILFVGRVISGITAASFATASAYIADVTPVDKRAATYGLLGAAWGFGFIIGPATGGFLGEYDPRLPFWAAAVLTLLNFCYGMFVLPESLPKEKRKPFSIKRASPVGSLKLLNSHPELRGLSIVFFLYQLAHQVLPSVFVLYAGHRYGWSELDVGLLLAVVGVCNIIVQTGLVRPLVANLGERGALLTGLFFGAAGYAVYGLAPTGWAFWIGVPVFALIGLFNPSLQALMTRHVGPTEQGQLQGANASIMGITGMIGPALFTLTFAYFISDKAPVDYLPGAAFILAALLHVLAMIVAFRAAKRATASTIPT